jgi:hypothetical protein
LRLTDVRKTRTHVIRKSRTALLPPRGSDIKSETEKRLRGLSGIEKEKGLETLQSRKGSSSKESFQERGRGTRVVEKEVGLQTLSRMPQAILHSYMLNLLLREILPRQYQDSRFMLQLHDYFVGLNYFIGIAGPYQGHTGNSP